MQISSRSIKRILNREVSVREKGTFLSTEILFGLLEYTCLLGEDLLGLLSFGSVQRLSSPLRHEQQGLKGGGRREVKGDLQEETRGEGHETELRD